MSRQGELNTPIVPYLALVRGLLDRDDIGAARKVLEAVPLDVAECRDVQRLRKVLAPPRVSVSVTRDADRRREYRWLRDHWQEYRGQWVALDGDRVVAAGISLKELRERLRALHLVTPPLVHRLD